MPEERTFANLRKAFVMAAVSGGVECGIAFCWVVRGLPTWLVLVFHAAVITGLAVWSCRSANARADIRLPLLLTVSTAALGPAGAAGMLLTAILSHRRLSQALPFEQWCQSMFPEAEEAGNVKLADEIEGGEAAEAEPLPAFSDVMEFGSLRQKQDLIAFVSGNFRPEFGSILKQALNDPESVIRVQAATAMSKLERSITERTLALKQRVRENPHDPEALWALGRHYDTWVFSGVLDPNARRTSSRQLSNSIGSAWRPIRVVPRRGLRPDASFCDANGIRKRRNTWERFWTPAPPRLEPPCGRWKLFFI